MLKYENHTNTNSSTIPQLLKENLQTNRREILGEDDSCDGQG